MKTDNQPPREEFNLILLITFIIQLGGVVFESVFKRKKKKKVENFKYDFYYALKFIEKKTRPLRSILIELIARLYWFSGGRTLNLETRPNTVLISLNAYYDSVTQIFLKKMVNCFV